MLVGYAINSVDKFCHLSKIQHTYLTTHFFAYISRKECFGNFISTCLVLSPTGLGRVLAAGHVLREVADVALRVVDRSGRALGGGQAPGAVAVVLALVEAGAVAGVVMNTRLKSVWKVRSKFFGHQIFHYAQIWQCLPT